MKLSSEGCGGVLNGAGICSWRVAACGLSAPRLYGGGPLVLAKASGALCSRVRRSGALKPDPLGNLALWLGLTPERQKALYHD